MDVPAGLWPPETVLGVTPMKHTASRRPPPLSPARQRLATMIHELGFGYLDGLRVVDGEPKFSPRPRRRRVVNLTADDTPASSRSSHDYRLRTMQTLFRRMDSIAGAAIVSIVVQHGLPVRLTIEETDEA